MPPRKRKRFRSVAFIRAGIARDLEKKKKEEGKERVKIIQQEKGIGEGGAKRRKQFQNLDGTKEKDEKVRMEANNETKGFSLGANLLFRFNSLLSNRFYLLFDLPCCFLFVYVQLRMLREKEA